MAPPLDDRALDTLFRAARTAQYYRGEPVGEADVRRIYDLLKWGPTSANMSPARFVWLLTQDARERLAARVDAGNADRIRKAPAAVIVGMDRDFHDHLPMLFPAADARGWFVDDSEGRKIHALRNGSLQGAYFIVAARALGFDVGPMTGFDAAAVDAEFFAGTTVNANFIATFGHGDPDTLHPRGPRLDFDVANRIL